MSETRLVTAQNQQNDCRDPKQLERFRGVEGFGGFCFKVPRCMGLGFRV